MRRRTEGTAAKQLPASRLKLSPLGALRTSGPRSALHRRMCAEAVWSDCAGSRAVLSGCGGIGSLIGEVEELVWLDGVERV
jgi:hypothetical protein